MSAWDDRTLDPDEIGVRAPILPVAPAEAIIVTDLVPRTSGVGIDFFWRQVGTDIEVRVRPDFLASGPPWQHQYAPTGLLTIHLAGDPAAAEPVREVPDPLEPIETPGPTFIRQAEWDDATQSWKMPDPVAIEIPPDD
jgi:hypothetical protein